MGGGGGGLNVGGVVFLLGLLRDSLFVLVAAAALLDLAEISSLSLFPPSLLLHEPPLPWRRQQSGMAMQTEPAYCSRPTHTHTHVEIVYYSAVQLDFVHPK